MGMGDVISPTGMTNFQSKAKEAKRTNNMAVNKIREDKVRSCKRVFSENDKSKS